MIRSLFIAALMSGALLTQAQPSIRLSGDQFDSRVAVSRFQVAQTTDRTHVSMDFVLDSLRVPSNRYRAFTPVIRSRDGQHEQRLKTLLVTGRTQDIIFMRDGVDPLYADNHIGLRRHNGQPQTYAYTDAVARQPWHQGAQVYVECDLCGCGRPMASQQALVGSLLPPDARQLVATCDVVPAPAPKQRSLHGSAYITFVVNKWDMKPDYMNNRSELRKITDTLDVMVSDPNCHVSLIKIHGWASPESPYDHNRMLAQNRAQSLTDYVRRQYNLPASVFAPAEATPENWTGLRAAVSEAGDQVLPHRQDILAIIDDDTLEPDPKEWRIKMRYPDDYQYLLREVYPGLRRSDYDISFTFSDFTLQQAVEVYKTRPYQLSLRELWDVAQTMEPHGADYNRVMQTAVNVYPDAPEALLNLANVALRQNDLLKAETLLQRAGDSPEAHNARAVLLILQQRYDEAEAALQRAADAAATDALRAAVSRNREAIGLLR